uniref:uncharacterized protein LOC109963931 isoform X2 n=1 Tax=Monopterus albus TaxID=43700 RepID=UPI0009B37C05|nr:uncharacterized protein LOC109963931 isoform X2 [Monopterus albus]
MSEFNIAELTVTTLTGGGEMQEPKLEELRVKLGRLQEVQTESYQLERIHKEKEELCRKLQFQCEASEQGSTQQVKQNKKYEELLEQYRCEIQEFKLKHRKQRIKFENQLRQLIEQHKNLHSAFTPERLQDEIKCAENIKSQLLSAEQLKLAQLHRLDEELQERKKQQQLGIAATETQVA